ncbi:hypothetical protein AVEN_247629-1 [Araneus ventricosus]|uniref:Uncharacterized protein n=1 Tax=Araneus ventricosus TaxID=182803 RepID=A0A4Y2RJC5_ARAVE|nr:hypothetical protein AVEN_247629-1 [Araneus ventricosus]
MCMQSGVRFSKLMCLLKLIVKPTSEETSSVKQDEENKEKEQDSQLDTKHQTPSEMASEKRISELEQNLNVLCSAKFSIPSIEIQKQTMSFPMS